MPRIPLYNQGQGPRVGVASGQLSPRASAAAFTAPGSAMAGFQKTFSDIGNVAKDFSVKIQEEDARDAIRKESKRIAEEARDFVRANPMSNPTEARTNWEDNFRTTQLASVRDKYSGFTKNQMRALESSIDSDIIRFGVNYEEQAYGRWRQDKAETFTGFVQSQALLAATNPQDKDLIISKALQSLSDAELGGYSDLTNLNENSIRAIFATEEVNLLAADESRTLNELEALQDNIQAGNGDYAIFDVGQRSAIANQLNNKVEFLKGGAVIQAQTDYEDAIVRATVTGNPDLLYQSRNRFIQLDRLDLAEAVEQEIMIVPEVSSLRQDFLLKSPTELNSYVSERLTTIRQQQLIVAPDSLESKNLSEDLKVLTRLQESMSAEYKQLANDPYLYVQNTYQQKHGKEPSADENMNLQRDMGILVPKFATTQKTASLINNIKQSQDGQEIASIMDSVFGTDENPTFRDEENAFAAMKQLREAGLSMQHMFIANNPNSEFTNALISSTFVTDDELNFSKASNSRLRIDVRENETVINHINSMRGNAAGGALEAQEDEHVNMIMQVAKYYMQQEGLDGSAFSESGGGATKAIEKAVQFLEESYDYHKYDDNITMRVPRGVDKDSTVEVLKQIVPNLMTDVFFFPEQTDLPTNIEAQIAAKSRYALETKEGAKWQTVNNDTAVRMLDKEGMPVFVTVEGQDVPLVIRFEDLPKIGRALLLSPGAGTEAPIGGVAAGRPRG
jgi:hypothetical protein